MQVNNHTGRLSLCGRLLALACLLVSAGAQTPTPTPARLDGPASIMTVYDGEPLRKGEFTFSGVYSRRDLRTEKLSSTLMAREMPYRIVLPAGYSHPQNSPK